MNRSIFIISALLVLFSLVVVAQDSNESRKATRAKGDRTFATGKTVYGKVSTMDEAKIVIENDYGAKKEIKLDNKTKFLNAKSKNFKMTDFAQGAMVKVTFREVDNTATVVQENVKK
ncbi:MAG: hypothetical protein JST84_19995 [Acidobacteria bacterium]|nr:hypothetical protein [Acidobacteriota bacterium]